MAEWCTLLQAKKLLARSKIAELRDLLDEPQGSRTAEEWKEVALDFELWMREHLGHSATQGYLDDEGCLIYLELLWWDCRSCPVQLPQALASALAICLAGGAAGPDKASAAAI